MSGGMKKATIPSGIRRGMQPARSPRAPEPAPVEPVKEKAPSRSRRGGRPKQPRATGTASGSASGRGSGGGGSRAVSAAPASAAVAVARGTNPYAGQKRRPMNHLVFEGISARLRELSAQLIKQGYLARTASQAQLTNAVLHFYMPADSEEAGELVEEWSSLTSVPKPSNPYRGQKRRPMNHLVLEGISGRLRELSEELIDEGYPARSASQAQLANAVLHSGMPADTDAAGELVDQWMTLTAGPR